MRNLMPEPPVTLLPEEPAADEALAEAVAVDKDVAEAAAHSPSSGAAWAELAGRAYAEGDVVTAYAFARTGYHRGLDQLRKAGWRGSGPVPWSHAPNRGFLRSLYLLGKAADAIGESDEAARCAQFLRASDPSAAEPLTAR